MLFLNSRARPEVVTELGGECRAGQIGRGDCGYDVSFPGHLKGLMA